MPAITAFDSTPAMFLLEAKYIVRGSFVGRPVTDKEFRSFFGVTARVCCRIWKLCQQDFKPRTLLRHVLWACIFLKTYATFSVLCSRVGVCVNTWQEWLWPTVDAIGKQKSKVIVWNNRFKRDKGRTCKVTVDGTDFMIGQPSPFSRKWYSHKFKGPGLRYELAICIQTGDIVWAYGPFPCGRWPDISIFRRRLMGMLNPGEKVEADKGYRGERHRVRTPEYYVSEADRRAKANARARHETVNKRLKDWGCLKQKFRHDLSKHKVCFDAVIVLTQLMFDDGHGPYQVRY